MEADLQLAGKSKDTIQSYLGCGKRLARHYRRSPAELSDEDVRNYLIYLTVERKLAPRTIRVEMAALCFLYEVTLRRPEVMEGIPRPAVRPSRAVVATRQEVVALLDHAPSLVARTALMVAYGAGLRCSEVCRLEVQDIDGKSGLLHVRKGKGGKDRTVALSPRLLEGLRKYWRAYRPPGPWLFPRRHRNGTGMWMDEPKGRNWLCWNFAQARKRSGVRKELKLHSLRHAYATHLLEAGVDIAVIRELLGHKHLATTAIYAHVRTDLIRSASGPLELLPSVGACA